MNNESPIGFVIPLSVTKVARIVEENAGFRVKTVRKLGEGLDYQTFLVDGTWVFRFPKQYTNEHDPYADRKLFQHLNLSTSVPTMDFIWLRPWGYPESVSGYKYVPGTSLEHICAQEIDQVSLAHQIARVLSELHSVNDDSFSSSTDQEVTLRTWIENLWDSFDSWNLHTLSDARRVSIESYLGQYRFDLPDSTNVLIHGDLGADHILVDEHHNLSGIIDWSNHTYGNRYRDFVGLWRWGGDEFCTEVFTNYQCQPNGSELAYIRSMGLISCIARTVLFSEQLESVLAERAHDLLEQRLTEITNRSPYDPLRSRDNALQNSTRSTSSFLCL